MIGGFSTPKKDKEVKVSSGMAVKTGQILVRGVTRYKPGVNVGGLGTMFARCSGKVYFTKKKTSHGQVRTFLNIEPTKEKTAK
ncbi:MAG: 50S ribosomal protein L27 [Candidatus Omnitrophica bacterium]|nr:50S ribosomal protein L27 [Candidatus Omnitrophota bacterium]MBU1868943.1 50S ribosomal protein L27 [Candidatus Omnitrophota bacterium]